MGVCFDNALYRVNLYVVENLTCPELVGTKFANSHIKEIWYRKGLVVFTLAVLLIRRSGRRGYL